MTSAGDPGIGVEALGVVRHLPTNLSPRVTLPVNGTVLLDGKRYLVDRRLGDHWHLVGMDKDFQQLTDVEVVERQNAGRLYLESTETARNREPLSPLVVGAKAHKKNEAKFAYVKACLDMPGGLKCSRPRIRPIIEAVAQKRGEKAPAFSTVMSWIKLYQMHGATFGTSCLSDRDDCKGRRGGLLPTYQEQAIDEGIALWLKGKTMVRGYARVCAAVRLFEKQNPGLVRGWVGRKGYVDEGGRLRVPALRTFERRCGSVDNIERDMSRKGPAYVAQHYTTWQTMPLPDRPYSEVEVDHGTLDILIIDPSGAVFGRPDIVVFRDRATAMILGYGLGFETPSYASFMKGLKHAIYPKNLDRFPKVTNPWPCFGRIENLFVDNALHFVGENLAAAARELNFNVTILPPRKPWLKGALERFFGALNVGLIHHLPGTTLGNIKARRDHEHLGAATLTLDEFEKLLVFWICQEYHARVHGGLGFIRGAGDVPLAVWAEKVVGYATPPLPRVDLFEHLVGDRDRRVVGRQGIEWDRIFYESPLLSSVLSHPQHRQKGIDGVSTKYEVVRDPFDLSEITLINHHTGERLRIPATLAYRRYVDGRTLHQHKVCLARARERRRKRISIEDLERSANDLAEELEELLAHPSRKKIQRQVARYTDNNVLRHVRSAMVTQEPGQSSFPDYSQRTGTSQNQSEQAPPRKDEPIDREFEAFLKENQLEAGYE